MKYPKQDAEERTKDQSELKIPKGFKDDIPEFYLETLSEDSDLEIRNLDSDEVLSDKALEGYVLDWITEIDEGGAPRYDGIILPWRGAGQILAIENLNDQQNETKTICVAILLRRLAKPLRGPAEADIERSLNYWERKSAVVTNAEPASLAAALVLMGPKERKAFLDDYYSARSKWADVRGDNPTPPDFKKWVEKNFPDRKQLGVVLSDLRLLDNQAYKKLINWAHTTNDKIRPDDFGFPSKIGRVKPPITAPTGAEVFQAYRRGDPDAPNLNRVRARAARVNSRHQSTKR